MTDRPDPPADPRAAFVVETQVKPDGRRIHYYEWPNRPKEPPPGEPSKSGRDRGRV